MSKWFIGYTTGIAAACLVFASFNGRALALPPGDSLPSSVCSALKAERAKYGTPIAGADVAKVLNATAWANRNLGMGMAGKTGGTTCKLPNGKTIACDYIVRQSDNVGWDVLGDSDSTATVNCNSKGVLMASNRPWVAPSDPGGSTPPPDPPPSDLTARVAALEKQNTAQAAQISALQADVSNVRAEVVALRAQVNSLGDRVLVLENKPPGSSCTVQEVSTSSNWGHSHRVKTCQ